MTKELNKVITKGKTYVLIIPNDQYSKRIIEVSKYFSGYMKSVCYVSLNKLFDSLMTNLNNEKININKFLFIDGITKSANPHAKEYSNCICISSASALTELSITINKTLDTGKFDGFLFDSLSTLLIYNKKESVSRFVHSVVNKIKASNTTAVFTALEGDTNSELLKEVGMYVDEVIHLE